MHPSIALKAVFGVLSLALGILILVGALSGNAYDILRAYCYLSAVFLIAAGYLVAGWAVCQVCQQRIPRPPNSIPSLQIEGAA